MLRFLQLRVVVNGIQIYPLDEKRTFIVPLDVNRAQIVISDGFHFTPPIEVQCPKNGIQHITISCSIEDDQFVIGLLLLILFYTAGLTSNLFFLKLLSFIPLFTFLVCFYFKRADFLKIKPV